MNTLETLLFPNTEIFSGRQFPLFLLFPKIHLLQPVESEETGRDDADIFNSEGLCQAHTPCPLGKDRSRFLHLIRDLRERRDDYAAQLSSLTVAAMSGRKPSIDDSVGSIAASLQSKARVEREEKQPDIALWQARLLLKIGEQLDREEEEVAMQMALLDDREGDLFKTLQGELDEEEETLFDELLQLKNKMARPAAGAVISRLKAWSLLYRGGDVEPGVWVTQMEEAADWLLERYEEKMKLPAEPFLHLELPANIGWGSEDAFQAVAGFSAENSELLAALQEMIFSGKVENGSLQDRWAKALQSRFPAEETGRVAVICYRLAGMSCGNLLGKNTAPANSTLAVIRWQEQ